MRSLLLTTALLLITSTMYAQSFEAGINIGASTTTIPGGSDYHGSKTTWNPEFSARFLYSISDYWQVGADIGFTNWKTTGQLPVTGSYGQNLGYQNITYSFAAPAMTFCAQFNRVIPFYSNINLSYLQSQLYFGVSAGGVITANDGSNGYKALQPDNTIYSPQFDYENGHGYTGGVQVGYSYFFTEHFGLNAEVAGRYASIYSSDERYAHEVEHYHLFYYYGTLGVRYRF